MTLDWTAVFIALLGLASALLAMNVSRGRIVLRIPHGEGPNHELSRAIRAHANSVEHLVPIGLLMLTYALMAGDARIVVLIGTVAVVSRVMITVGILKKGLFRLRTVGAFGTYLVELGLVVVVLIAATARLAGGR